MVDLPELLASLHAYVFYSNKVSLRIRIGNLGETLTVIFFYDFVFHLSIFTYIYNHSDAEAT